MSKRSVEELVILLLSSETSAWLESAVKIPTKEQQIGRTADSGKLLKQIHEEGFTEYRHVPARRLSVIRRIESPGICSDETLTHALLRRVLRTPPICNAVSSLQMASSCMVRATAIYAGESFQTRVASFGTRKRGIEGHRGGEGQLGCKIRRP